MARKSNATLAEKAVKQAQEVSKEDAEKQAVSIRLSDELRGKARELGAIIGTYAREAGNERSAKIEAALTLFDLTMEGYIGKVNPRAENFISTLSLEAWAIAHPGTEYKPSQDQVVQNALTQLRRIAKAISLDGYVHRDGFKIPVKTELLRILKGGRDAEGKMKEGAFNPAQLKAHEWNQLHDKLCTTDFEYAKAVGYIEPENPKKPRGRMKTEPSEKRMESILKDVDVMLMPQLRNVIEQAVEHAISLWPASAKSYQNVVAKVRALAKELDLTLRTSGDKLAGEIIESAKSAALEARNEAAQKAIEHGKDTLTNLVTDELTTKRKAATRKARKGQARVQSESTSEPAQASA